MSPLFLAATLLVAAHARPSEARPAPCGGAAGYVAVATLDEGTLPAGVEVLPGGTLPRLVNHGAEPLLLLGADLEPTDKLVDGQAYHWFATGVPVEGMTHLTGWQNPYAVTSALLVVPSPVLAVDAQPPAPQPFDVVVVHGTDRVVLRGTWRFEHDPDVLPIPCEAP